MIRRDRICVALVWLLVMAQPAAALDGSFSYQGRIDVAGAPYDGTCDLRFRIYPLSAGGAPIGGELQAGSVVVENGLFNVALDGTGVFTGGDRWLEIDVRCPDGGGGPFLTLAPRLQLRATPYSLFAAASAWQGIDGKPSGFADDIDDDVLGSLTCDDGEIPAASGDGWACVFNFGASPNVGVGLSAVGPLIAIAVPYRLPQACAAGQVPKWDGGEWDCGPDLLGGDITGVAAGTGLTGGGASGNVMLAVSFAGSGVAATAARSDHDHYGQDWVGNGRGLAISNTANTAAALFASQGDAPPLVANSAAGVTGVSEDGPGVRGVSLGNAGVRGEGVSGAIGVFGQSSSGIGVSGTHSSGSGTDPGVRGHTSSLDDDAAGVVGIVGTTAPGGFSAGVRGINNGEAGAGIGVYGSHAGSGWAVYGTAVSGRGVYGDSTSGVGVRAESTSGRPLEAYAGNPPSRVFYVDNDGDVFADGPYSGAGADFAEMLPAEADLEPGDVLAIGAGGRLVRSTSPRQRSVAGVYSTRPGFLGGASDDDGDRIPLAVVGVVPVKASAENGPIRAGDLLTSAATPGHAMRAGDEVAVGTVIGKALGDLDEGTSLVSLLLVLQ
jgi:hypothetical protein